MTKIQSFCLFTPLKVLVISIQVSVLLIWPVSWMEYEFPAWLKPDIGSWTLRAILLVNGFVALFSFAVALNILQSVRNNILLSFFSFFLPAIIVYTVIIFKASSGVGYTLFMLLPFLIPQVYYYIRFRKRLKSGEFE